MTGAPKEKAARASMEEIVGRLLLVGTVVASVLVGVGVAGLVTGFSAALATQLVTAGLLTLVATPILRVVAGLWVYLKERDYVFAGISAGVLVVLALGVWLGQPH